MTDKLPPCFFPPMLRPPQLEFFDKPHATLVTGEKKEELIYQWWRGSRSRPLCSEVIVWEYHPVLPELGQRKQYVLVLKVDFFGGYRKYGLLPDYLFPVEHSRVNYAGVYPKWKP